MQRIISHQLEVRSQEVVCIQLWSAVDSPALCAVLFICTDGDTVFVHGACVDVNPFAIKISKSWIKCA